MSSQDSALTQISLSQSPEQVAACLSHLDNFIFFDSSGNLPKNYHPAISIIAAMPERILKGNLQDTNELEKAIAEHQHDSHLSEILPNGGAMGWIDYNGDFCFGIYTHILIYQHDTKQWWSRGNLLKKITSQTTIPDYKIGKFSSNFTEKNYISKVNQIHQYITAGDIYQVNLTQRFQASVTGSSLYPLYQKLRKSAPAPMAAYLNLDNREILSSSPETFLRINQQNIETRPIKGTRPRFDHPAQDLASAQELMASEKEIAELVMITDLERNDLGKVCQFGSVTVPELTQLETLEHVYHLVSRVEGTLNKQTSHLSAIQACSPGGSITGAPKKRAREIIEELETVPRGLYTGSVGYIGFNQISQFNIVIRTLVREGDTLQYHVGAGIVADSDPAHEYAETLQKAKGIRKAIEQN